MERLNVIYEDNHIIVVQKIPNIPSQQDKTGDTDMLTLVKQYIKEKYNKPGDVYLGLVHRLDRPVGGVMVFARTSKAAARLSEEVRSKVFKKAYLTIVDGKLDKTNGTLENYLIKNERTNLSKVTTKENKNAKFASLDYEVIKYDDEAARERFVRPRRGRGQGSGFRFRRRPKCRVATCRAGRRLSR